MPERPARDAAQLLGDHLELQHGDGTIAKMSQRPLANGWAVALRGDRMKGRCEVMQRPMRRYPRRWILNASMPQASNTEVSRPLFCSDRSLSWGRKGR